MWIPRYPACVQRKQFVTLDSLNGLPSWHAAAPAGRPALTLPLRVVLRSSTASAMTWPWSTWSRRSGPERSAQEEPARPLSQHLCGEILTWGVGDFYIREVKVFFL